MTPQEVADLVKALVEPKSWSQPDVFIRGVTGKLVVKQVPSIHRQIEKLLDQLGASVPTTASKPQSTQCRRRRFLAILPLPPGEGRGEECPRNSGCRAILPRRQARIIDEDLGSALSDWRHPATGASAMRHSLSRTIFTICLSLNVYQFNMGGFTDRAT